MLEDCIKEILAIPYKGFKERVRLVAEYCKDYRIEVLEDILYMERK